MESKIREAIKRITETLTNEEVEFSLDHPVDTTYGDYASNVALVLSKRLGKAPQEIAEQFLAALTDTIPGIQKICVAGPGFINFYFVREFFIERTQQIIEAGDAWGWNESMKGKEVIFEYTSPNLFKPLHVGNLLGNIIGESLSRIYEMNGALLHRVNYPSDIGLSAAKAVWGLRELQYENPDILQIGEAYRFGNESYENDETAKRAIEAVNRALYSKDDPHLEKIYRGGIQTSLDHLSRLAQKMGTTFDAVIFESEVSERGAQIVKEHLGDGIFEESDGAIIYRGERQGLHTRVFINSKGIPTYEAKDVGNFARKEELFPKWSESFVVTGSEQTEYFKVLFAALRELFPTAHARSIEHIPTGFLTLSTGKMSSRKGNVLTAESLIDDIKHEAKKRASESRAKDLRALTEMIAIAALKYQILRQAPGINIVFDKEKALSFEGDSGPYLQYTFARIQSVDRKASEGGISLSTATYPSSPYEIERMLYRFEAVVKSALHARAPHKIATFLIEVAGEFNRFYAEEKIADSKDPYAPYKRALTQAVGITIKNGLFALGIKAPPEM